MTYRVSRETPEMKKAMEAARAVGAEVGGGK
jgi:hypothetical protein